MINKDEKILTSPPYMGFLIIKKIYKTKEQKIMLDEVVQKIKEEIDVINYRQLMFSLLFLYQSGVIDFAEPYIYKK